MNKKLSTYEVIMDNEVNRRNNIEIVVTIITCNKSYTCTRYRKYNKTYSR